MPLHIAYFCYPSAYSLCFLNESLRRHGLPIRTVIFSKAAGFASGRPLPFHRVALKTIRESGFRYTGYELAFTTGSALIARWRALLHSPEDRLLTFRELRREFDLAFHASRNFNDHRSADFLSGQGVNLGFSAFNNQLFKAPLIDWFEERRGIYNVHPALLPDFRGVEPIVAQLLSEQSVGGVTLHSVNPKIDQGAIHYQEEFPIEPGDSVFSINHRAFQEGARLAQRLVDDLSCDRPLPARNQEGLPIAHGYAPFPSRDEIAALRRNGRHLIRLRHFQDLHRSPGPDGSSPVGKSGS